MIQIKVFTFNAFQENSYILSDETGECIIIDPGMNSTTEEDEFMKYIQDNKLTPVRLLNTHTHIDHIAGNSFVGKKFRLKLEAHVDAVPFLNSALVQANLFGIHMTEVLPVESFLEDKEIVTFGNSSLEVLLTPGHAAGSLCFYAPDNNFVITGDVLFNNSIGRTDLPTGDYDTLQKSIWTKLFTLPDSTLVYPGHGPHTTIGAEKSDNPFVAIGKE